MSTAAARTVSPAVVTAAGLLIAAIGFALVGLVDVDSHAIAVIAAYTVMTVGTGMVAPLAIDMIVSAAPPHRAGAAAGLGETGAEFGGALGIAVLGSGAAAVYRTQVVEGLPAGLPPDSAQAAMDTLGGAVAVAGPLPGPLGGLLLDAAYRAFTQGFTTTAVAGAVLLAAAAVAVAMRLRPVRTG